MRGSTVATTQTGAVRRASDRGFTVMEVIVAAFLLAVGLIATSQLVLMATGHVAMSRQQTAAATLASQAVEQYRDVNFATILALTGCPCSYTSTPTVGGTTYNVLTVVTPNNPATSLALVSVTVTWGGNTYGTSTIISPLQ